MQTLISAREVKMRKAKKPPRRILVPKLLPPDRTEAELRRALLERSIKSKLIGGSLVVLDSKSEIKDRITRVTLDQDGLRIKTYSKLDVVFGIPSIRSSDLDIKEKDGVIFIKDWANGKSYILVPNNITSL
ncbi:MAG: hypothetical protein ACP5N9_03300 [Candidatus Bilamarchaeum sp.]|jgi:hypothetical protein